MTAKEVSEYLKIPLSTLCALTRKGKIQGVKIGKHWRYREADVQSYINGSNGKPFFPVPEPAKKNGNGHDNQRKNPRINSEFPATISVLLIRKNRIGQKGIILNISEEGILFASGNGSKQAKTIEVGDPVRIIFQMPGLTRGDVEVEGRIVHRFSQSETCYGIKFRNLTEAKQGVIRRYVG